MAKAKTPKQLGIKIRSLQKQLKKAEVAMKKAKAPKKRPVRRKAKRKAVRRKRKR